MFKTLLGLVTGNPIVAAVIGVAAIGAIAGPIIYVRSLQSDIAAAHDQHETDVKANGALATQKASLIATVADQQTQIVKLQQVSAEANAAAEQAHVDKQRVDQILDKVIADASAAPESKNGLIAPLLSTALGQLCQSRPGATAAGCGN